MKYDICPKCGYGDNQTPFLGFNEKTLYCDNCGHEWEIEKEDQ